MPRSPKSKSAACPLESLVRDMIDTFAKLGSDPMARIDARLWHAHYRRCACLLGCKFPKDKPC